MCIFFTSWYTHQGVGWVGPDRAFGGLKPGSSLFGAVFFPLFPTLKIGKSVGFECYALGYLVNPPSAWPGFSRPLSTPVHEHIHKCRGGIAQARATTPSLTPRLVWVACAKIAALVRQHMTGWPGRVAQAPRAGRARALWSCSPCWRPSREPHGWGLGDQLQLDDEVNSKIADRYTVAS